MKINQTQSFHPINSYKNQFRQRPEPAASEKNHKHDVVDISHEALQMQGTATGKAQQASAHQAAVARAEKVNAVRTQIEAGQYQINHKAVAEKMIAFWKKVGGRE